MKSGLLRSAIRAFRNTCGNDARRMAERKTPEPVVPNAGTFPENSTPSGQTGGEWAGEKLGSGDISEQGFAPSALLNPGSDGSLLHPALVVSGLRIDVKAVCKIGRPGDRILTPEDQVMLPYILQKAAWQEEEVDFVAAHIRPDREYAVLDVGANVGLFTLQCLRGIPKVRRAVCIEPDRSNFDCLKYNLQPIIDRVQLHHFALGEKDEISTFYRDTQNFGNYSLNPDAMRNREHERDVAQQRETAHFMEEIRPWLAGSRLIWKSDTQGYDELIISRTPMALWSQVDLAVVELWRIRKPTYSREEFRRRIEAFPHRSIGMREPATTEDVFRYLDGTDWLHDDLYMWR